MYDPIVVLRFRGGCPLWKNFDGPAYFTRRHCVQVKDCNSRARTVTLHKNFFLRNTQPFVSFCYLIIFLYTGKPDQIIHLNLRSKDNFEMVHSEQQFFLMP